MAGREDLPEEAKLSLALITVEDLAVPRCGGGGEAEQSQEQGSSPLELTVVRWD